MRSKQLHNFGKFLQYCMFHMQKLIEVCQSGARSGTIISDTLAKNKSDQKGWSDLFFFFVFYQMLLSVWWDSNVFQFICADAASHT